MKTILSYALSILLLAALAAAFHFCVNDNGSSYLYNYLYYVCLFTAVEVVSAIIRKLWKRNSK